MFKIHERLRKKTSSEKFVFLLCNRNQPVINVAITGRTSVVSVTVTLVGSVTSVNVTTGVQQRSPVAHPMGQSITSYCKPNFFACEKYLQVLREPLRWECFSLRPSPQMYVNLFCS